MTSLCITHKPVRKNLYKNFQAHKLLKKFIILTSVSKRKENMLNLSLHYYNYKFDVVVNFFQKNQDMKSEEKKRKKNTCTEDSFSEVKLM